MEARRKVLRRKEEASRKLTFLVPWGWVIVTEKSSSFTFSKEVIHLIHMPTASTEIF